MLVRRLVSLLMGFVFSILLFVPAVSTAHDIGDAIPLDRIEGLLLRNEAALAAEANPPGPSAIIWAFLAKQYPSVRTLVVPTPTGRAFVVGLIDGASATDAHKLLVAAMKGTANLDGVVPESCPSTQRELNSCCHKNPYVGCVEKLNWDFCKDAPAPDLCATLERTTAYISMLYGLGREFRRVTHFGTVSDVIPKLEGGRLYFFWPYLIEKGATEKENKYAFTEISSVIASRLVDFAPAIMHVTRMISSDPNQALGVVCSQEGIRFEVFSPQDSGLDNVLVFGMGKESTLLKPKEDTASYTKSMYIDSDRGRSRVNIMGYAASPIGTDSDWSKFADIGGGEPDRKFFCSSGVIFGDFYKLKPQMNSTDAAYLVFGSVYMNLISGMLK